MIRPYNKEAISITFLKQVCQHNFTIYSRIVGREETDENKLLNTILAVFSDDQSNHSRQTWDTYPMTKWLSYHAAPIIDARPSKQSTSNPSCRLGYNDRLL